MTTTTIGRCAAQTFNGTEPRQCTRPASADRDGLAVCRQHAKLARVSAWNPNWRVATVAQLKAPPTEAEIVERFIMSSRFVMYVTAYKMVLQDIRAESYAHVILTQNDRYKPLFDDYNACTNEIHMTAGLALVELGTLTVDEIMTTLRTAAPAA